MSNNQVARLTNNIEFLVKFSPIFPLRLNKYLFRMPKPIRLVFRLRRFTVALTTDETSGISLKVSHYLRYVRTMKKYFVTVRSGDGKVRWIETKQIWQRTTWWEPVRVKATLEFPLLRNGRIRLACVGRTCIARKSARALSKSMILHTGGGFLKMKIYDGIPGRLWG